MKRKLFFTACLISVSAAWAQVTVSPANTTHCAGEIQQLTATGGGGSGTSTLFSENFEGAALGNFTATVLSGTVTANSQWTNRTSPYTPPTTVWNPSINSGSKFALSNSDYSGANVNTALESGVLNTTGYTSLSLTFRHYYSDYSATSDFAYVEVSVNGGTSWTTIQTYSSTQGSATGFASVTITLNDYLNQPNFKFRLRYVATWNDGWAVDDVVLSGASTSVASYTWSPVAGLYTDAAATIPYTGSVTPSVYAKPLATTTYTASYTSGSDTFTGSAVVTVTTVDAPLFEDDAPILCGSVTLNELAPEGITVIWYAAATGGSPLAGTTVATDGTYFAAQSSNGCESLQRTQVNVSINNVEAPTGDAVQYFCNVGTVGDLVAQGAAYWYAAATGGEPLAMDTPLVNLEMYYASQVSDGCESTRFPVQAIISYAVLETPESVSVCDSYTLPELDYGNYYTDAGGNGTMMSAGDVVSQSGVVYIYASDFSNPDCTAETWFDVNIIIAGPLSGDQEQTIEAGVASEATVGDLVLFGDSGGLITWYLTYDDAAGGENALAPDTQAIDGHQYFATITFSGCTSAPYGVTANVVLGNDDFAHNAFRVHPNPVTDKLIISGPTGITSVKITNMLGQMVHSSQPGMAEAVVDMASLSAGTYLVTVNAGNAQKTVKVVRQ